MKSYRLALKWVIGIILLILTSNTIIKPQSKISHPEISFTEKNSLSDGARHSPETIEQLNNYDVKCYVLDLNVGKNTTEIAGSGTMYAKVQDIPLDTLCVELIDSLAETTYMIVDSVKINGQLHAFVHNNDLIKVALNPPSPVNSYISSTIYYHGNGEGIELTGYNGITNGSAYGSYVTLTYSEPYWSKVWWPCKQILDDKADSVFISITTDSDCKAGSNGILKAVIPRPGDKIRYEWKSNYPIAYFLISFAVGQYIENITYAPLYAATDSVLIQSYLFQNCPFLQMQLTAIQKTKDFIQLFGELFGNYPFAREKYGYCLSNGDWGAMEHQTMTTIGYQALDTSANYIGYYYFWYSAHELAHSWFGNNVTSSSWQDIWIGEGFASYGEYLALQYLISQSDADFWMNDAHQFIKYLPWGSVYVPYEFINNEFRIFDYRLTYKKGAAIVHTIRFEVRNDSLFFLSLRNFLNEYKDSVASGLDFKNVLEQTTGQDFTDFFNQWYFGEGYPVFNIGWTQSNDTLKIHSVQSTSTLVTPLFKMHLELLIHFSNGDTLVRIYQQSNDQYFEFYFPQSVTGISVDPHNWIIDNSTVTHADVINIERSTETFRLSQNFPNPFNALTIIKYYIPQFSKVELIIYDLLGNQIGTPVSEEKRSGDYELRWNAFDLPSGVYFYQLKVIPVSRQTGNASASSKQVFIQTKKMMLIK